jgi:N-acetylglucosamine kinase-like BadF-type ATPase
VPDVIAIGMAGVDGPSDAEVVREIVHRLGFPARVAVANDALVALVALVAGAGWTPGIVLLAGTGSIVCGRTPPIGRRGQGAGAPGSPTKVAATGSAARD